MVQRRRTIFPLVQMLPRKQGTRSRRRAATSTTRAARCRSRFNLTFQSRQLQPSRQQSKQRSRRCVGERSRWRLRCVDGGCSVRPICMRRGGSLARQETSQRTCEQDTLKPTPPVGAKPSSPLGRSARVRLTSLQPLPMPLAALVGSETCVIFLYMYLYVNLYLCMHVCVCASLSVSLSPSLLARTVQFLQGNPLPRHHGQG